MRRTVSILVATAAAAMLAGCASPAPAASPDDDHLSATTPAGSSTPSPTPSDEPDPTYGERPLRTRRVVGTGMSVPDIVNEDQAVGELCRFM